MKKRKALPFQSTFGDPPGPAYRLRPIAEWEREMDTWLDDAGGQAEMAAAALDFLREHPAEGRVVCDLSQCEPPGWEETDLFLLAVWQPRSSFRLGSFWVTDTGEAKKLMYGVLLDGSGAAVYADAYDKRLLPLTSLRKIRHHLPMATAAAEPRMSVLAHPEEQPLRKEADQATARPQPDKL